MINLTDLPTAILGYIINFLNIVDNTNIIKTNNKCMSQSCWGLQPTCEKDILYIPTLKIHTLDFSTTTTIRTDDTVHFDLSYIDLLYCFTNTSIKHLYIPYTKVTNLKMELIQQQPLQTLHVNYNYYCDIVKYVLNMQLHTLIIGSLDNAQLASLTKSTIRTLNIESCYHITDSGMQCISKSLFTNLNSKYIGVAEYILVLLTK